LVHIKKLEVYGFKSFGFRNTVVNFEKGLVAVTGPNGSGKSNILDAIMFAIGENSPKALRVDKFQSLFHDSQNSSHRLIRVSLTFDNSDRGIPLDSDNVTLTRQMEGQNGESQYSLNGKSVSKAAIMELLEVVLAAPNNLNIVQQGMITRISELNSEERRKIIEDIVGLSYFDEKKAESVKQLDEADRRLEVAFARMGEIRKRIDELESERNDQLRYEQLGAELKRFKAIQISNSIRTVKQKLASGRVVLEGNTQRSIQLSSELEAIRQEIERLDAEKTQFIREVDAANKARAQVEGRISSIVHESERAKAMLGESERRIAEIERRLPAIETSKQAIGDRSKSIAAEAESLRLTVSQKKIEVSDLKAKLDLLDGEVERIGAEISRYANFRQKLETRHARMTSLRGRLEILAATLEEKINTNRFKARSNDDSLAAVQAEIGRTRQSIIDFSAALQSDREKLKDITSIIARLSETQETLQTEIARSSALLARGQTLATKFEERASVAKSAMIEDFAIAELMQDAKRFGVRGLVHDLIRWDADYERAVLAAGSEWMKAFVVKDVKSMVEMATYAKEGKLPRLRIIPLDIIARFKARPDMPDDDVNVIGRLSDFVACGCSDKLALFLFGDTILTRTSSNAYVLARQGYRAVSVEGELFEPEGGSLSLDFGSKISDMTKAILLGDSVEALRETLEKLSTMIGNKGHQIREIAERISEAEAERVRVEIGLENLENRLAAETESTGSKEELLNRALADKQGLQAEYDGLTVENEKHKRRLELLGPSISALASKMNRVVDESSSKAMLAAKNFERGQIVKALDAAGMMLGQSTSALGGIESRLELESSQLTGLDDEKARLTLELEQRRRQVEEVRTRSQSLETELRALRYQEQQVIDSSGDAYSVLQEYEKKIKELSERERRLSKEHNTVERDSALLRKDISDLTADESRLGNDLAWLGFKGLLDEMDVAAPIKELSDEYESVKKAINLRADESYVLVMDGYRGMSGRRNQLENERNSIFSFIQHIEQEKRDVFMEAFQRVDGDIRATFEKMTGGSAWLQIENQEEIFSSGVMLLAKFPSKNVPRESTALSGGEKTIAATVFLLALQSLKPSPFYLMDEVDAHLDAQNTEHLSKVLLERSNNNQIIMVTLKDTTVGKAGLIYGVYSRDGASQVVRYKNPALVPLAPMGSG